MNNKNKIRTEVERLLNKEWKWQSSIEGKYRCETYRELLQFIDSLPEEPVSEDLEEAADEYAYSDEFNDKAFLIGYYDEGDLAKCFRAGANWQKEQMIKNAVDGVVTLDFYTADREVDVILADNVFADEHGIKDGDKVKLIIVKDERK